MDLERFLREAAGQPGLPGNELPVARWLREEFAPHCAEAYVDPMQNMIARQPGAGGGPKVYVTAHMDEIGLCVTGVEKDGCLRFTQMGGVDPRVLPGSEVRVLAHGTGGEPLAGIVGAKPPHLLTEEERKKNYKREDLFIDLGLPFEDVKARVRIGDRIQLVGPLTKLAGDFVAAKTLDDRAGVAVMLMAAERLAGLPHAADIFFVCAGQEEVGSRGALTSCYAINPDIGVAIDVTHGAMPDCKPDDIFPLDKVVLSKGPNLHPKLLDAMLKVAAEHRVETKLEISPGVTWTDASELQISRAGIPTALLSLPLKYMHTTVETCSTATLKEAARLLAAYLASLGADWRDALCL